MNGGFLDSTIGETVAGFLFFLFRFDPLLKMLRLFLRDLAGGLEVPVDVIDLVWDVVGAVRKDVASVGVVAVTAAVAEVGLGLVECLGAGVSIASAVYS